MKHRLQIATSCLLLLFLCSCSAGKKNATQSTITPVDQSQVSTARENAPQQLPVRFQKPTYITEDNAADPGLKDVSGEYEIKVGANISSTQGPQPLWDILKRLAKLKGMNVSWASDVNQNTLVDVDINADESFFTAIDNLLRQVDYYHEVEGKTIVVKYKETKRFHLALPFMTNTYTSNTGGNFLTSHDSATGTEGTVKITSGENQFDAWENIKQNLDTILDIWQVSATVPGTTSLSASEIKARCEAEWPNKPSMQEFCIQNELKSQKNIKTIVNNEGNSDSSDGGNDTQKISTKGYYTLDKHLGLITVTAPRPTLKKVEDYINSLKKELYRQVVIEAKIIEVYLQDDSKIGLDWSKLLKDFSISGLAEFGIHGHKDLVEGQVYPYVDDTYFYRTDADNDLDKGYFVVDVNDFVTKGKLISNIRLNSAAFSIMINALEEQGTTHVLANPKITVLNGQPAMINIGEDVTYINKVEAKTDKDGNVSYSIVTDSVVEGVALGVVASILDDEVVLQLSPITTDIKGDQVEHRIVGEGANQSLIGLPRVGIREMNSTVRVKNGSMLVLGGLIDKVERNESKMPPLLGKLPVLKYLFGYEQKQMSKRELVILLQPKII